MTDLTNMTTAEQRDHYRDEAAALILELHKTEAERDALRVVVDAALKLMDEPRVYILADDNCHVADARRASLVINAFEDAVDDFKQREKA